MKRLINSLFLVAIVFALTSSLVYANHETTGLMQARTPCNVDEKGTPVAEKGVNQTMCLLVAMPGYPDQVWVFVEDLGTGDVVAVFILDKNMKVIKKAWTAGKAT